MRMTRQRRLILEELRRRDDHPTVDHLYARVRKQMLRISLGTVYRNLDTLSALGAVQTLELSGRQKRFDGNPNRHYHIRCLNCGRMDDAPIAPLNRLEDELYEATVYTIMGHRLEFMGLCPQCSKQQEARRIATAAVAASQDAAAPASFRKRPIKPRTVPAAATL